MARVGGTMAPAAAAGLRLFCGSANVSATPWRVANVGVLCDVVEPECIISTTGAVALLARAGGCGAP